MPSTHYDVIANSETFLNSKINDSDICIHSFSHDVFRKDHPNDTSRGGVCLYYRENLPITRVKNLEILDEAIVCQISIKRKKIYFVVVYRSPSQTADEFNLFLNRLELTVENIQAKNPDCIIITGDFNCRTQQWWSGDIEDHHGTALDDLIQSKNFSQLIDEPTHIINDSSSCIDLIITSQPFLFVEHGIHPSLFKNCHHEIVHGKLNLSVPPPPVFKRKLWDYNNADIDALHDKLRCVDWYAVFSGLDVNMMVKTFTDLVLTAITDAIPNKLITCNSNGLSWITPEIKTAIRRKHRVYKKYVSRGRKIDEK